MTEGPAQRAPNAPQAFTPTPLRSAKRSRIQLSCNFCRQGKLKCNRNHPACDQCIKRSRESSCAYAAPRPKPPKQGTNMKERIRHLEGLVVELMNTNNAPGVRDPVQQDVPDTSGEAVRDRAEDMEYTADEAGPEQRPEPDSGAENKETWVMNALGAMRIGKTHETSYIGATHWEAILDDIDEVKKYLEEDDGEDDGEVPSTQSTDAGLSSASPESVANFGNYGPWGFGLQPHPSVLLSTRAKLSKQDLLNAMPPKPVVDRLIANWFNSPDPAMVILHGPSFQEEYRRFWENRSAVEVSWLAVLYAIMFNSCTLLHRMEEDVPLLSDSARALAEVDLYRNLANSALCVSGLARPTMNTVQALMIFREGATLNVDDPEPATKLWLLLGLVMRLALRMGYHRDGKHFPNISPFEAEMRRRIWWMIFQLDTLYSFMLGLPGMARLIQSDTEAPNNLSDSDISPLMTVAPTPRPESDHTPLSYSVAKCRIMAVFAEIADVVLSIKLPPYERVLSVDERLQQAYALIPPALKMRPLDQSITDSSLLIMQRLNLQFLYLKARCILHRRFLTEARTNARYSPSRGACVGSAMQILRYHRVIHDAGKPGGQLQSVKWFMTSVNTNDFLLASMIVCLELTLERKDAQTCADPMDTAAREEMLGILEGINEIWANEDRRFSDVKKASKALTVMLNKIYKRSGIPSGPSAGSSQESSFGSSDPSSNDTQQSNLIANTPVWPSASNLSGTASTNPSDNSQMGPYTPLEDMLDMPLSIDWNAWDSNFYGNGDDLDHQMGMDGESDDLLAFGAANEQMDLSTLQSGQLG
ncbi:fungal-specific transcription factor domain-containing protein [Lineolata rhizophorae]|uniref:Fungal-specific transcription factor domain-containing protein n=1 Tax=Lineolata rhizophorae TaxID=578093 RepID=A0A6A6NQ07_9PEZI|nr:fungal-specific transcription factor domain-containing protein [Lineolata rhizophorae]